jgi:hypothetical protein
MGWFTQDESSDSKVEVKSGTNAETGSAQTEFLFIDKTSSTGEHGHTAIDSDGNVTYDRK